MDAIAYRSLRDLQDRHWWFVGRLSIVSHLIRRFTQLPQRSRILEAGCGYGGNLRMLEQFGDLHAFEVEDQARAYASTFVKRPVVHGLLPEKVGFENESFDLVAVLDVLEHIDDDLGSLRALRERLTEGGSLMLTVPALPWLWSEHDEIHHHKRRYTKAGLKRVLREAGLEPIVIGYFNTLLFPLAMVQRLALRLTGGRHRTDEMPPTLLNGVLSKLFAFERHLVGRVPLPIGLSLYAIARQAQR
jgi:SAM-dependent methyltransferase